MHLIVRYVRPYFKRMGLGLTIKLLGTVLALLLPYILAPIIDDIIIMPIISIPCPDS